MDYGMIQKLADSAQERADRAGAKAQEYKSALTFAPADQVFGLTKAYHSSLNDSFYWLGHANAYRGVLAGLDIMAVVEDEMEEEGSCP